MMKMWKKPISFSIVLSLVFFIFPSCCVSADERDYSISSALNDGWSSDTASRSLVAAADLGEKPQMTGCRAVLGDDPSAVSISRAMGKDGWVLSPDKGNSAKYINIDVSRDAAYSVDDGTSYAVEIEYYDNDDISGIAMEYASKQYQKDYQQHPAGYYSQPVLNSPAVVKEGEYVILKNSGMWRTYTWFLDNPTFDDAMDGFDLRVGIYSDSMSFSRGAEVCISQIKIYKLSTASRVKIENAVPEDHIGNIYFKGEEIQICADFSSDIYPMYNKADGRYPLDLRYTVKDSDGKTVFTAADKINIEPLETVEHTKKFRVDKFDIYTVDIEAYNTDKKLYSRLATEFSYVNTDKGKTANEKAGVQIALPSTDDAQIAQLAKNAGFANVRMMCYYYNWRKSALNYEITGVSIAEAYKSMFRAFKKAGLDIDANLHSASWMGTAYDFSPVERTPPYTEDGLRRWADYCTMMTELFGDTVDSIEIWNEYNLGPNHSFNRENRPASDYGKLYRVSKDAIKKVNPDMPVVAFNTSGAPDAWIEEVLKSGVTDIDVTSVHPYRWEGDPITYDATKHLIKVNDMLESYGVKDKPFWITEYGYSSHFEDVNTNMQQGMYNAQSYALIMNTGVVDRFYFYCFLDKNDGPRADRESNFGMVKGKFTSPLPYTVSYGAKPGYLILGNMNMLYSDAEFMDCMEIGTTGRIVRSKSTADGKQTAMMFSNKKGGEIVTLDLGCDKVTLIDAYGNEREVFGTKGIFSFGIDENIQYIKGDFKSFNRVVGGAYPTKTEFDAVYGDNIKISIANYSGHGIYAKAEPMPGSALKETQALISGEGGELVLENVDMAKGTERMKLTLFDGDTVYFSGDVSIKYQTNVSLDTTLIPLEKGWSMRCTLENLSASNSCTGRLTFVTPSDWQGKIGDSVITLNPGEVKKIDVPLPVAPVATDEVIEIGFVTDETKMWGTYSSGTYNFSAALKADSPVMIDGSGDEWTEGFINLNRSDQFHSLLNLGNPYGGPDDLSAKAAVKWDDDNFYLFVDVLDNKHFSTGVIPKNIWQMDSVQFALVYDPKNELPRSEFEEIAIGEIDGENVIYRHKTRFKGEDDYTKVPGSELAVKTDGLHTYYEVKIPWDSIMTERVAIEPGTELKFAMVINENDGVGRVGYLALGDGIVSSKNSSLFKKLYIRD